MEATIETRSNELLKLRVSNVSDELMVGLRTTLKTSTPKLGINQVKFMWESPQWPLLPLVFSRATMLPLLESPEPEARIELRTSNTIHTCSQWVVKGASNSLTISFNSSSPLDNFQFVPQAFDPPQVGSKFFIDFVAGTPEDRGMVLSSEFSVIARSDTSGPWVLTLVDDGTIEFCIPVDMYKQISESWKQKTGQQKPLEALKSFVWRFLQPADCSDSFRWVSAPPERARWSATWDESKKGLLFSVTKSPELVSEVFLIQKVLRDLETSGCMMTGFDVLPGGQHPDVFINDMPNTVQEAGFKFETNFKFMLKSSTVDLRCFESESLEIHALPDGGFRIFNGFFKRDDLVMVTANALQAPPGVKSPLWDAIDFIPLRRGDFLFCTFTAVRGVAGAHVLWSCTSGGSPFYKDGDSWVATWESPTSEPEKLFKNGIESFQRGLRSLGESFKNPYEGQVPPPTYYPIFETMELCKPPSAPLDSFITRCVSCGFIETLKKNRDDLPVRLLCRAPDCKPAGGKGTRFLKMRDPSTTPMGMIITHSK